MELKRIREIAILDCYGKKNVQKNKEIKTRDGEVITAWFIDGFESLDELLKEFDDLTIFEIVKTYDSGM